MTEAEMKEAQTILAFADHEFVPDDAGARTAAMKVIAELATLRWNDGAMTFETRNKWAGCWVTIVGVPDGVGVSIAPGGALQVTTIVPEGRQPPIPPRTVDGLRFNPVKGEIEIIPGHRVLAKPEPRLSPAAVVLDAVFEMARTRRQRG